MVKCEYCGTPRQKGETKCPACGAYYPDDGSAENVSRELTTVSDKVENVGGGSSIESRIGAKLGAKINSPAVKKVTEALIMFFITLFVGIIGVHRFVKGKVLTGILWLCTAGLFGVGYIVDLVTSGCTLVRAGVGLATGANNDDIATNS